MGNTLPQLNSTRSVASTTTTANNESQRPPPLKKSRSLREYVRSTSLMNSDSNNSSNRTSLSQLKTRSIAPTDAEIIDIQALRCGSSSSPIFAPVDGEVTVTSSPVVDEGETKLLKQLGYIHSCVRKDKGFLGMMTENMQSKHLFSNHQPENTHILDRTPDDFHMHYKSIYLKTFDGEYLHSFWIFQPSNVQSRMTVLYLHGAGGNISHRLEVIRLFYDNLHCNVLIIDYRGFGTSTGSPSELGLYLDAQSAYDYLVYKEKISPENILVFGTSLGASVAIQLVSDPLNPVKAALFENAFISVPEIAKYFLSYAKSVIGVTKSIGFIYLFDSIPKVRRIQCPCIYLTGLLDPTIPTWMTNTLYNETRSASKRELFEYPFGKHNDLPVMPKYFENIQTFLDELSLPSTQLLNVTEALVLGS